ncbi:rho GDP-dissociation inhibitor 1-like isoform X2 [Crassostrea virginica]|uniref:Rho GDP-dissociation inhibitor 3 n=1 Tax=Crassostrea virginica TaxID=6565 RepID=A0A8B8CG15_CRAVI|nr:rho GDP-dissociation inhibitor 1-like isoform X4 [Crassostrea virginica]
MAEAEDKPTVEDEHEDDPNYKPPAQKSVKEIVEADQEDESLRKYKESLLGGAIKEVKAPFPDDPRNVIVSKLSLVVEGRTDKELDLTGDLSKLKEKVFTIKEGAKYRMKVSFYVQREIVSGLRYEQKTSRKGIQVDKSKFMVGSYGPKETAHEYLTPVDEAPSGMLVRGSYTVESKFTDDDRNSILEWKWKFEIKKDWDD